MSRGIWIRCFVGAVLWLALVAASTALYSFDSDSGVLELISFAIAAMGTLLLGYVVGSWWALAVPILAIVILDVFIAPTNDPGLTAVAIWVLLGPIGFLIGPGIMWRCGSR